MAIDQDPVRVAEKLADVVVEFGLRRLTAVTDTHTVIVQEPGIWEDDPDLQTHVKEIDL